MHRGRNLGRIMGLIQLYCRTYHSLYETGQYGDGICWYHGKVFATFTWPEDEQSDLAHFTFQTTLDTDRDKLSAMFAEQQFMLAPYVDQLFVGDIYALVYQVRKAITFDEALAIRHVRDKLNGEWNDTTVKPITMNKITDTIAENICFFGTDDMKMKKAETMKEHIALCAIYNI